MLSVADTAQKLIFGSFWKNYSRYDCLLAYSWSTYIFQRKDCSHRYALLREEAFFRNTHLTHHLLSVMYPLRWYSDRVWAGQRTPFFVFRTRV